MIRKFFLLFAIVALSTPAIAADLSKVTIKSGKVSQNFMAEIADDDFERERGLMFRKSMPKDSGMLFIFKYETAQNFWMKNTLIPLDIIFIERGGKIVKIAEARPHDLKIISSGVPIVAAIEINGGEAKKRGIKAGDRVIHPLIKKTENTSSKPLPKSK
ncbi:MAG: hypothetical protein DI586_06030 [Micavibrio aeruginosavorus]|uniref:DUF192 domain-containing protein n=1 Tax=Micavibrio aeruginosavorus TaxID=349221 RepID=A0A2W5FI89_9BACT|nr:MAG: hypothetical protein DI586_06030 [Micavibrio aeruginosavorus]